MFNVKRWEGQECQNILPYISNAKRRKRHYFQRVEIRTCHIAMFKRRAEKEEKEKGFSIYFSMQKSKVLKYKPRILSETLTVLVYYI